MTDNARLHYSSATLIVLFMLHQCYWIPINYFFFNLTKVWLNNMHVLLDFQKVGLFLHYPVLSFSNKITVVFYTDHLAYL